MGAKPQSSEAISVIPRNFWDLFIISSLPGYDARFCHAQSKKDSKDPLYDSSMLPSLLDRSECGNPG